MAMPVSHAASEWQAGRQTGGPVLKSYARAMWRLAPGAGRRTWHCGWRRAGRLIGAAVILASSTSLGAAPAMGVRGAPAQRGGMAGRYLAVLAASCAPAAAKTKACQALLGPFAAGLNPLYATCDATGRCTFDDTFAISEHNVGAPAICGPTIVSRPFNGTCRGSDHGTLQIKKGVTGLPDLWIVGETTTFFGSRTLSGIASPFGTNVDTGIPMVPGVYDSARYLGLVGQGPTAGVAIEILVTRLPS